MKEDRVAQYRALRENCGLWQHSDRALLALTGEDRERLLNGLVTCEVKGLVLGHGVCGFFTDVKGHILADVVIRAAEDRLWLELPASSVLSVAAHIAKYIVVDRVEVQVGDDRQALTLAGPRSAALLESLLDIPEVPLSLWSHLDATMQGQEVLVSNEGRLGIAAITLWSSPLGMAAIRQGLLESRRSTGLLEVDDETVEIVRVEEGMAQFGVDYGHENLPQETGIPDTVSYSKGCYLGQEVVARLHYRGQVARRLCRLQSSSEELPQSGCRLVLAEREAGIVTSAARSPIDGRISALAMLQRRATGQGTELQLEDGRSMQVV